MTLLNAPVYDEAAAKRRRNLLLMALVIVVVLGSLVWMFRFWPQERTVDAYFAALEQGDFSRAYGIYVHDPEWKQHAEKYKEYPLNDFIRDWGPASEYGHITSHRILSAQRPPHGNTGVVVSVSINGRPVPIPVWVGKDGTLTVWPY
jgi:hypothetical protein